MKNISYFIQCSFCILLSINISAQSSSLPKVNSQTILTPASNNLSSTDNWLKTTTTTTANLPINAKIIWGGPNDPNGEFDGGLNDWTTYGMDANSVNTPWTWEADADVSEGAFAPSAPIASPSAANGAAAFNSDFYDNGGDQNNQGDGPNPAPHFAHLVSPIIDLNNKEDIAISFYTYYRNFSNTVTIAYSNDGGMTWSESIPVHTAKEVPQNINAVNTRKLIYLPGAGDTDQFQFKFTFAGEYYFWMIDDVALVEHPDHDLEISSFFYTPASFSQPDAHIDADVFTFSMNVTNAGLQPQTNVILGAQVRDANMEIIYETTAEIDEIAAGVTDSTFQITGEFVPDMLIPANYRLTYSIESDSIDQWVDDNFDGAAFRVSDLTFAAEDGDENWESYFTPSGSPPWQIGNVYQTAGGFGDDYYTANSITFAGTTNSSDPIAGKTVNVWLVEVSDNINDGFGNLQDMNFVENPDLTIVGFGSHIFSAGEGMDRITVSLENFDEEGEVILKENTRYLALIDYSISNTIFQAFNAKIDYGERLNFLAYNENSSSWFGGFTDSENLLPVIRLELGLTTVDTKDRLLPASAMTVSPNPTAGELLVQMDLENVTNARLTITDISGKIMDIREFENLRKEAIRFDLSDFVNGTYLVRLATETGARTSKVVVQR